MYIFIFFFFNDPATTEIYPLSLPDPLPISQVLCLIVGLQETETPREDPPDRPDTSAAARRHGMFFIRSGGAPLASAAGDRKSTRLNSSHLVISYAVFCLKKKKRSRYTLSIN